MTSLDTLCQRLSIEAVELENTDIALYAHLESECRGSVCALHNRSDHHMRDWPQHWRGDRGLIERICPHGVGHPDPDSLARLNDRGLSAEAVAAEGVHGCDGCCHG